MKNILIILGILLCINLIITGICRAVAQNPRIDLSTDILISNLH